MKTLAVIPARFGSTRFPGKPIAPIRGRPMIEWVYRRTVAARCLDDVIVATDDRRIMEAVERFQGDAVMTDSGHSSGTDRVAEVIRELECDLVVNVQGDEPLIKADMIEEAVKLLREDKSADMSTLASPAERSEVNSRDTVKVVLNKKDYALYFSRALIPAAAGDKKIEREACGEHNREKEGQRADFLQHIGLYVFRREFLLKFTEWDSTPLEKRESLEQLRALENGHRIKIARVNHHGPGVDRPEDIEKVETILRQEGINGELEG